jgi:hypothetical protein
MPRFAKHGLILEAPRHLPWSETHAAVPFVDPADVETIYFSTRDAAGRSHTARGRAGVIEDAPVLAPGSLGAFDDSGAMGSCLVHHDGRLLLYYTGWNLGVTVPFRNFTGLAVSEDSGRTFARLSSAPILGPNDVDPFMAHSPWVLVEDGRWRMWYCSATGWDPRHRYHIRLAESDDGIDWHRDGRVCIDFAGDDEYALSRPVVVRDADRYRMWFSARGERYRLGYAESDDGFAWERNDGAAGLEPSDSGWDSEMVCYACVFDGDDGVRRMLYNGNGYGRTGIGLAVAE